MGRAAKGQGSISHTENLAGKNGVLHWGLGWGWGAVLSIIPEGCGNLGRGGALGDSSDYFGKCPVLGRKEWVEANLACEKEEEIKPH